MTFISPSFSPRATRSAALGEPMLRARDNNILIRNAVMSMFQYMHVPIFPHSMLWQRMAVTGTPGWGETISFKPPIGAGDGLWRFYLSTIHPGMVGVDLDSANGGTLAGTPATIENTDVVRMPHLTSGVGMHGLKEATLSVNNIIFNKLWGKYIFAFEEVFGTEGKMKYDLNGTADPEKLSQLAQKSQVINWSLPFFFDRHPSLMLVLEAMHFGEIEVSITFRPFNEVVVKPKHAPAEGYGSGQNGWDTGRYVLRHRPDSVTWDKTATLQADALTTFKAQGEGLFVMVSPEEGGGLDEQAFRQVIPAVQRRQIQISGTDNGQIVKKNDTKLGFRGNVRSMLVVPQSADAIANNDHSNCRAGFDTDGPAASGGRDLVPNYMIDLLTLRTGPATRDIATGADMHLKNCEAFGRRIPSEHIGLLSWQVEYMPHQNTGALCATRADELYVDLNMHPKSFKTSQSTCTVDIFADVWITIIYEDGYCSLAFQSFY